ncbi:hypothetical protein [Streptomyces griseoviridis]|uniref:Integral membrane protein n=1 Tax=Streptomyces griseoviridis TaxID=45398 RepID=A0ABT9LEI1_STRGD|nr:hypothetical protein [Streptomyces griseoviridis]MDP9682126.1 hypothetical protein [Streptomyces griseoviridis]
MRPRTWVLVLAAVFAVLQLANVTGRDTPDTKNYLSYALSLSGEGKRGAAAGAIEHYCASRAAAAKRAQSVHVIRFHRADPTARVTAGCREREWANVERRLRAGQTGGHTAPFMPERFMQIFEARPGYPVFLVPFVSLLGVTWGVWTASVLVAAAGGVLVFVVLRTLAVPVPLALTGQALYYVLPCGTTAMRPMTEGLLMALTLAAVWGCALALRGGREGRRSVRRGYWLVGGALALLFTVKHSQALFLGVCLAAAGAAVALVRRRRGTPPGRAVPRLAGLGLAAALLTSVLARLLHYPSESESLQDLLTGHFARPDRADPWPEFLQLQGNFWTEWSRRQLREPLFAAALAAGVWGALRRPAFGAFLVAAGATGILTQAGHPDIGIWGERLIVLAWLLPVVGVPLLLEPVVRGGRVPLPAQGHPDRAGAVS